MVEMTDPSYWENKFDLSKTTSQKTINRTDPAYWENKFKSINKKEEDSTNIEILNPEETTDLKTIALAQYIFNPKKKIDLYAKARGISPERYSIIDNEIVFRGNDGKIYREESSKILPTIARFGTETLTNPITYLPIGAGLVARKAGMKAISTIGAESAGAALGTLGEEYIGEKFFENKPKTISERAIDIGTNVGTGLALEGLVRGTIKLGKGALQNFLPSSGVSENRKILKDLGILDKEVIKKIEKTQKNADQFGIDLNIAEAAENYEVKNILNQVSKSPYGEEVNKKIAQRDEYILENTPEFIRNYFSEFTPPIERTIETPRAQFQLRRYVREQLSDLNAERAKIVSPFYETAFKKNPTIDTTPIIEYIDSVTQDMIEKKAKVLQRYKNDLIKKTTQKDYKYIDGVPTLGSKETAVQKTNEMSLKVLDDFKKQLGDEISGIDTANATKKSLISNLKTIKEMVVDEIDKVSEDYKRARVVHSLLVGGKEALEKQKLALFPDSFELAAKGEKALRTKENLIPISKISDDQLKDAGSFILSTKKSSPEIIKQVKEKILSTPNGKEIWDNSIADALLYKFQEIPLTSGEPKNIGIKFYNTLLGTVQKQHLMKSALDPKEYSNFYNFLSVLKKTGFVKYGQPSTTRKALETPYQKSILRLARPLTSWQYLVSDKVQGFYTKKGIDELVKIITDPNVADKLRGLRKKKDTELIAQELASIMGWTLPQLQGNSSSEE